VIPSSIAAPVLVPPMSGRACQKGSAPAVPVAVPVLSHDRNMDATSTTIRPDMPTLRAFLAVVAVAGGMLVVAPAASGQDPDLERARERANAAAAELAEAETALAGLEVEVAEAQRAVDTAEAGLAALADRTRIAVIEAYVGSAADPSDQLMLGDDLNRQVQAEALMRLVTQSNADAIDQYRAQAEDAAIAREALEASLGEQEAALDQLADRRADLDEELERLEALERERLAAEAAARAEQARREAAARRTAEAEARTPVVDAPDSSGPSAPSGPIVTGDGFLCPVQGAVAFVDSWGSPRSGGRSHRGVDMMASRGTPVVASVSGSVSHRGNSIGGLSFHLDGDDGNYYYGTHLDGYANENAGHVQAGTVIGYVGDTGNARGNPHLHFEIHPGGRGNAINPYPTVRAAC
jgi:murein DD-endopeptidase MepM/ murein hydrolase activator NlpD